ncbi:hypothetical protein [Streptomyces hydrogenans]|uniref:Uncharacterized protein n=1 Tax=Streptomyces hydrogenans TaxID=1873719 RepID=A0ABQ3PJI2_9ACTN|nr:hypothetical protein [Streptomyces hydrogenans]GHF94566.1 hypothetical protein GCM10018784_02790 [Streptomyces hydrogenans]GHI25153.1 hypothetical protein Shyd_65240 [Streptomyces hydrogenans]
MIRFFFWCVLGYAAGQTLARWAGPYIFARVQAAGLDDAWDVYDEEVS